MSCDAMRCDVMMSWPLGLLALLAEAGQSIVSDCLKHHALSPLGRLAPLAGADQRTISDCIEHHALSQHCLVYLEGALGLVVSRRR